MTRADRYADAACAGHIWPDLWHSPRHYDVADAVTICRSCPIRQVCLDDALAEEDGTGDWSRWGIRGGLLPQERSALASGRRRTPTRRARPPRATSNGKPGRCPDCDRPTYPRDGGDLPPGHVRRKGRGLCGACYSRGWRATAFTSTIGWRQQVNDDRLNEWVELRDSGWAARDVAPRLGMTPKALMQALRRARLRGDQRGSLAPFARGWAA